MGTQNSHADHVYLSNVILMSCCSYSLKQCILYTTSLHMEFEKEAVRATLPQRLVSASAL